MKVTCSKPNFFSSGVRQRIMKMHVPGVRPQDLIKEPNVYRYVQFLTETRRVYWIFEHMVPIDHRMRRIDALTKDITNICQNMDVPEPHLIPGGPGEEYASLLSGLVASKNVPAVTCHMYTFYFANAAGGSMIGDYLCQALQLGSSALTFYEQDAEVLKDIRQDLDTKASRWTDEQRQKCMEEVPRAFEASLKLLEIL
jgi:heme oxygenase